MGKYDLTHEMANHDGISAESDIFHKFCDAVVKYDILPCVAAMSCASRLADLRVLDVVFRATLRYKKHYEIIEYKKFINSVFEWHTQAVDFSERTVMRSVNDLVEAGVLFVSGRGQKGANIYYALNVAMLVDVMRSTSARFAEQLAGEPKKSDLERTVKELSYVLGHPDMTKLIFANRNYHVRTVEEMKERLDSAKQTLVLQPVAKNSEADVGRVGDSIVEARKQSEETTMKKTEERTIIAPTGQVFSRNALAFWNHRIAREQQECVGKYFGFVHLLRDKERGRGLGMMKDWLKERVCNGASDVGVKREITLIVRRWGLIKDDERWVYPTTSKLTLKPSRVPPNPEFVFYYMHRSEMAALIARTFDPMDFVNSADAPVLQTKCESEASAEDQYRVAECRRLGDEILRSLRSEDANAGS